MQARFRCSDPFATPGRLLDVARQMGFALEALRLDRGPGGAYMLTLALGETDPRRARAFLDRVDRLVDLSLEDADA